MSVESDEILHSTWFGVFVVEGKKVIDKILFEKDPFVIAEKRYRTNNGMILEEEKELAKKYSGLKVTSKRLTDLGGYIEEDFSFIVPEDFSYSQELLQKSLTELGTIELRESVEHGEHLAKAVETIQDLNESINMLLERLRDWYSIHYPELKDNVKDEDYLDLIADYGERDKIQEKTGMSVDSTGGEISEKEEKLYRRFANIVREKRDFRDELWNYIEAIMNERAPTITALTGVKLGAELIAQAGSLEKLAKMPSSTIQVLGAEKALFSHLSKGTKPPKHGLILQHPYVHKADKDLRGKIARTFANKIAIAARVDYFGTEDKGDQLRNELEEKIKEIKG